MDWYRQEFDIPQTASTQQTLHLLASEQLIIAQDAGNYARCLNESATPVRLEIA